MTKDCTKICVTESISGNVITKELEENKSVNAIMYEIENGIDSMELKNGDLYINGNLVLSSVDSNKQSFKIKKIKVC